MLPKRQRRIWLLLGSGFGDFVLTGAEPRPEFLGRLAGWSGARGVAIVFCEDGVPPSKEEGRRWLAPPFAVMRRG